MKNDFINKMVDYIEENIYNDFSLDDLEKRYGISKSFLTKAFQVTTTITIFEYLRNRRLYLAALDLINTNDKISVISDRYAYKKPECFIRAFNNRYGYTPAKFRLRKPKIDNYDRLIISVNIVGGEWAK